MFLFLGDGLIKANLSFHSVICHVSIFRWWFNKSWL